MKKSIRNLGLLLTIFTLSACETNNNENKTDSKTEIKEENSGETEAENKDEENKDSEREVVDMQLSNANGLVVNFNKKGAMIDSIKLNELKIAENGFVAGRVANRIANGKFDLDGETYTINKNFFEKHVLHGGTVGFDDVEWTKTSQTTYKIVFELDSPDGDQGFPGKMHVTTTYSLNDDGELSIEYKATSDKKTLFNPTNHLYMNMNGVDTKTWKDHSLWVDSTKYTKTDNDLIPTGDIVSVEGTTLNYSTKTTYVGNNDSNLALNGNGYRKVAELTGNKTNITVDVSTDMPGLQVYNDDGHICLETQFYPDAIHHENFPSIVLEANTEFYSKTSYKFVKQ